MDNRNINISVVMVTYNHEHFIEAAIDSILSQETENKIELIIADDCSTDNTSSIIDSYIKKYSGSHSIVFYHHPKNVGMKENFLYVLKRCKGDYIAICDGDDYWIDPYKLQKQVVFLESNDDFVLVGHAAKRLCAGEFQLITHVEEEFKINDFLTRGALLPSASILFRNILDNSDFKYLSQASLGDWMLVFLLCRKGRVRFMKDEVMSVYRIHDNGIYSSLSLKNKMKSMVEFQSNLLINFPEYKNALLKDIHLKKKNHGLYDYSLTALFKGYTSISVFLYGLRVKLRIGERIKQISK